MCNLSALGKIITSSLPPFNAQKRKYLKYRHSSVVSNNIISLVLSVSVLKDRTRGLGPQLSNLWAVTYLYDEFHNDLGMKILQAKPIPLYRCSFIHVFTVPRVPDALSPGRTFWEKPCLSSPSFRTKSKLGTSSSNWLTTHFHMNPPLVLGWHSKAQFACGSHLQALPYYISFTSRKGRRHGGKGAKSERWQSDFQFNFKCVMSFLCSKLLPLLPLPI